MKLVTNKVELVSDVPSIKTIYAGYRRCYSDKDYAEITATEKMEAFVSRMMQSGHESPLEHVSMSFHITCSRACSHQLVRHRVGCSYCVAGDTKIRTRSDRTNNKTIAELFAIKQNNKIAVRCVDEKTHEINYNRLKNIVYSGKKEVYEVETNLGYKIKTTAQHMFFTKDGWKHLCELSVGDYVYVNGIALYKDKEWLHNKYYICGLSQKQIADLCGVAHHTVRAWIRKFHLQKPMGSWCIGKKPVNFGKTKDDYEPMMRSSLSSIGKKCPWARKFGKDNPAWKEEIGIHGGYLRSRRNFKKLGKCSNCGFIGYTEIHHLDKNPINSDKKNLIELCIKCHKAIHKYEVAEKIIINKIVSITPIGIEDTYDIIMPDPHHNFIANGFVVHNSQQSQRYVKTDDLPVIVPPSIAVNDKALTSFKEAMEVHEAEYKELVESHGIEPEDARFELPNAAATHLIVTMNCRALLHFFEERCCARAQWEIRTIALLMLDICQKKLPCVFQYRGAKCERRKLCPEAKGCGRYPMFSEVRIERRRDDKRE